MVNIRIKPVINKKINKFSMFLRKLIGCHDLYLQPITISDLDILKSVLIGAKIRINDNLVDISKIEFAGENLILSLVDYEVPPVMVPDSVFDDNRPAVRYS